MRDFFKRDSLRIVFIFLISALFQFVAAESVHPDFEPLFSIDDVLGKNSKSAYTNYTADEVFEMSLLFSECERGSDVWKDCMEKFKAIKKEASSKEMMKLGEEERGKAILKLLYRDYLKAYSLSQTKIDLALEGGNYNCVSSAVLYMAAAKAAGLMVRGQKTTQHAFCSVYIEDPDNRGQLKKIDVETTNPYGFNPGSKEEIEHESQIKKYYVVPKKYYSNRQEISDGAFTGLIAGNLCSDYIKKADYKKGVPLGAARYDAVKLESPNSVDFVRSEFEILAANYINIIPDSAGVFAGMLDWYYDFIERWGNSEFLQKNLDSSFINLLALCNREKNYTLAQAYYDKYKARVSQTMYAKADEIMTDIIIITSTDNLSAKEKVEKTNQLMASDELAGTNRQNRAQQHLEIFWIAYLNELMKAGEYIEGYSASSTALEQLPKSSKVKNMQTNFYNNLIAILHNGFARYANAGDYETARAILIEGLKKFPDDRILKKDLSDIDKLINKR